MKAIGGPYGPQAMQAINNYVVNKESKNGGGNSAVHEDRRSDKYHANSVIVTQQHQQHIHPKQQSKNCMMTPILSPPMLMPHTGFSSTPVLKFQIVNGNNSKLIKRVLESTRYSTWFETPSQVD